MTIAWVAGWGVGEEAFCSLSPPPPPPPLSPPLSFLLFVCVLPLEIQWQYDRKLWPTWKGPGSTFRCSAMLTSAGTWMADHCGC